MNYNFDSLSTIFETSDIEWLKGCSEGALESLGESCYNPVCLKNMQTMLEKSFRPRTVLSLCMTYPDSFRVENKLFCERIEEMTADFSPYRLNSFYWNQGYLTAFSYMGADDKTWKVGLEKQREDFRKDRAKAMKKLVDIGFDEDDVQDLEETCSDFVLDVLVEFYLEDMYLEKLELLLNAGFHEYLLLQLFVDNPELFTTEISGEVAEQRIGDMEDVWELYDAYGEELLYAFLDEDDAVWSKFIDGAKGD